jgi:hypothetical protein
MSSNPYAQPVGPSNFGQDFLEPTQQRLSVLAVMALVFGCICFIPGTGAIAIILGGAAAFFISSSNGRLRGMGLAVAGIVLGLLFTLLWVFIVVGINAGMSQFTGSMIKPADSFMTAIDKGDFRTARTFLVPESDKAVTDEMLQTFKDAYQGDVGSYKGVPTQGIIKFISAYSNVGPAMNGIQGRQNQGWIPMPAEFANGYAAVFMGIDEHTQPSQNPGGIQLPMKNIGVGTNKGQVYWLIDPATMPASPIRIKVGPPNAPVPPDSSGAPVPTPAKKTDDQKP